jgi:hypothetical protein
VVEAATHMPREAVTCHLALFGMATPAVTCTALLPKCTAVATLAHVHHTTPHHRVGVATLAHLTPTPTPHYTYTYTHTYTHTYTYTY